MSYFTSRSTKWKRVSRANRCPICGKPDWCTYTGDVGNPDAVICSRVESSKRIGTKGAGWLHRLRDDDQWKDRPRQRRVKLDVPVAPIIDFGAMAVQCESALGPHRRGLLAAELGVGVESLNRLRVGWSERHKAFTFPMADAGCQFCGIRLRGIDGRKWSVKGGRQGLFIPACIARERLCSAPFDDDPKSTLFVCEGPTDTAALLDLDFSAVGRPSCSGGVSQLLGLIRAPGSFIPRDVVIVADGDSAGHTGAWHLSMALVSYVPAVRIISPPDGIKDARAWVQAGASRLDVLDAIDAAPALQLTYGVKAVAR